jgi:hypothetical protein
MPQFALAKDGPPIKQIVLRLEHSRQLVRRVVRGERRLPRAAKFFGGALYEATWSRSRLP